MPIIALALKNIRRKLSRSIALALAVALVAGLLFAGAVSLKGVTTSIGLGSQRLGADLMIVPAGHEEQARTTMIAGRPSASYMPAEVFDKVLGIKGVKRASPQIFLSLSTFQCCSPVDAFLIGFDPENDFTVTPWLKDKLAKPLGRNEIIIGRSIPVQIGDQMIFYGQTMTVVGYLADTGFDYIDHGIFMTLDSARAMIRESRNNDETAAIEVGEDVISTVLAQLEPEVTPERGAVFVEYEIEGVRAIASQDVIGAIKNQLFTLLRMIVGIGLALWLVTIALIAVVFSMVVNERQREIGLLRSLGAKRRTVFALITLEAGILATIGGLAGVAGGGGLLLLWKNPLLAAFKLPYLWPEPEFIAAAAILALLAATATGVIAVLYPAFSCSRLEPYEAIRQGE